MSNSDRIEIRFNGGPIGTLEIDSLPQATGRINYIPYRSGSHYLMHSAIAEGQPPTCTFTYGGLEYSFVVESLPGYGQLQIRDLRRD